MDDPRHLDSFSSFLLAREAFIDDPGCDPDLDTIETELGRPGLTDRELLSAWVDMEILRLGGRKLITVHRHLTVRDFDEFVAAAADGDDVGDHWSDNPETWSHYCDAFGSNVRITGSVSAEEIDWFTTFQRRLAFPAEREIVCDVPVSLSLIANLDDGRTWRPNHGLTSAQPRIP